MTSARTILETAAVQVGGIADVQDRARMVVGRERAALADAARGLNDADLVRTAFMLFDRMFEPSGNLWADLREVLDLIDASSAGCTESMDWCDTLAQECHMLNGLYPTVLNQVAAVSQVIVTAPVNAATRTWTNEVFRALPPADARPTEGLSPWTDIATLTQGFADRRRTLERCQGELLTVQANLARVMDFRLTVRSRLTNVEGMIADSVVDESTWRVVRPYLDPLIGYIRHERRLDLWDAVQRIVEVLRQEAASS